VNGAEHYRAAERLIGPVLDPGGGPVGPKVPMAVVQERLARAQVHATLALAAAHAATVVVPLMGDDPQITEWGRAIGWAPHPTGVPGARRDEATPTVEREWAVIWPRRADGDHDDCDGGHTADGQCVETRGSEADARDLVRRWAWRGARVAHRELPPWTVEEEVL
jgi:hypothetical protein